MMNLIRSGPWRLKGEGNAGAVFAYLGDDVDLAGKVLKVMKPHRRESPLSEIDTQIWSSVPGMVSAGGEIQDWRFPELVMRPLLGADYVGEHVVVELPGELSRVLLAQIKERGRQPAPQQLGETALVLPDYTLLPTKTRPPLDATAAREDASIATISLPGVGESRRVGNQPGEGEAVRQPILGVEIKPKCGFLPTAATIHPRNGIKKRQSRFTLHQHLKLDQGSISGLSEYDPLDLFSGERPRACHALRCLLQQPQNNLRFFLDGAAANVGAVLHREGLTPGRTPEEASNLLAELVAGMLIESGVLDSVLRVQKLDRFDVEGVSVLYHRLARQGLEARGPPPASASEREAEGDCAAEHAEATAQLMALPPSEALAVIRDYLIAATAKDCSIMMACRRLPNRDSSGGGLHTVYEYQVRVADLDLKVASKIATHLKVDAVIVAKHAPRHG